MINIKKIEYTVLLSCSVGGESHWSGTFLLQLLGDILDSWTVSLSSSAEDPRLEQEGRRTEETPSPLLFMMTRDKKLLKVCNFVCRDQTQHIFACSIYICDEMYKSCSY